MSAESPSVAHPEHPRQPARQIEFPPLTGWSRLLVIMYSFLDQEAAETAFLEKSGDIFKKTPEGQQLQRLLEERYHGVVEMLETLLPPGTGARSLPRALPSCSYVFSTNAAEHGGYIEKRNLIQVAIREGMEPTDPEQQAQWDIIIGHELGHYLMAALRKPAPHTGRKTADAYLNQVTISEGFSRFIQLLITYSLWQQTSSPEHKEAYCQRIIEGPMKIFSRVYPVDTIFQNELTSRFAQGYGRNSGATSQTISPEHWGECYLEAPSIFLNFFKRAILAWVEQKKKTIKIPSPSATTFDLNNLVAWENAVYRDGTLLGTAYFFSRLGDWRFNKVSLEELANLALSNDQLEQEVILWAQS